MQVFIVVISVDGHTYAAPNRLDHKRIFALRNDFIQFFDYCISNLQQPRITTTTTTCTYSTLFALQFYSILELGVVWWMQIHERKFARQIKRNYLIGMGFNWKLIFVLHCVSFILRFVVPFIFLYFVHIFIYFYIVFAFYFLCYCKCSA